MKKVKKVTKLIVALVAVCICISNVSVPARAATDWEMNGIYHWKTSSSGFTYYKGVHKGRLVGNKQVHFYKCDVCGYMRGASFHKYVEKSYGGSSYMQCTECGYKNMDLALKGEIIHDKAGSSYKVTKVGGYDNTVTFVRPKKNAAGTVRIPETITVYGEKYKVTAVATKAFYKNAKVRRVVIGNGVVRIGSKAFYGCKSLKSVYIGNKVKYIGAEAFRRSTKLSNIEVHSSRISGKNVGKLAFSGVAGKVTVKTPAGKRAAYSKLFRARGLKKGTYKALK